MRGNMRKLFLFVIGALLLASAGALAEYPDGFSGKSSGWSGWKWPVRGNSEIDAIWTVPALAYDSTTTNQGEQALQWIGIQATAGGPLEQAGVIEFYANGSGVLTLYPFYECAPRQSIQQIMQPLAVGDQVYVKITCNTNCTQGASGTTWNITVQNLTNPWTFTLNAHACNSYVTQNALAVVEPQLVANPPIPNFGTITFHDIHLDNASPRMDPSQSMYDYTLGGTSGSTATINISNPSGTNDAFMLCWGAGPFMTFAPCAYPVTTNDPGRLNLGF